MGIGMNWYEVYLIIILTNLVVIRIQETKVMVKELCFHNMRNIIWNYRCNEVKQY